MTDRDSSAEFLKGPGMALSLGLAHIAARRSSLCQARAVVGSGKPGPRG